VSRLLLIVLGVIALALVAAIPIARRHMHAEAGMTNRHGVRAALAAVSAMLGSTASTAALAVPPTTIGVTVTPPANYRKVRSLANLAAGSFWGASDHHVLGPEEVDRDGNVKALAPGITLSRILMPLNPGPKTVTIRCSWQGQGSIRPGGKRVEAVQVKDNGFTFRYNNEPAIGGNAELKLSSIDPVNPIRNIDCRETSLPADARIDPQYVESLRDFKVIRFMDWQATNLNAPVTWATRHLPTSIDTTKGDGVAIEDMIALVKATHADPWFNMPWNGDDDYFERFARMVHDNVPADRTVYVEMGNELWNQAFRASRQAQSEGVAARLDPQPFKAGFLRYAERLAHVMDIWKKVYADRPGRLVRVAACQNGSGCAKTVLGYQDTAKHVDALATAPYFGGRLNRTPFANADEVFAALDPEIDRTLDMALQAKAVAAQYGKRYIAYEGGQHLILKDVALEEQVERDPRMYEAYKKYLDIWRSKIGDTLALYASSGSISRFGAWGLIEYIGQPLSETPKMRAVQEAIAADRDAKTTH
jgi:hypothetical protein